MKYHELCELFPEMAQEQYEALREGIRGSGLIHDIVLYEGSILDGKHRHRACIDTGTEPRFINYEGVDPAGYVRSVNADRRHLTKAQSAIAAVKLKEWYAVQAKKRELAGIKLARPNPEEPVPQGRAMQARDQAAATFGISGKSVDAAEKIMKQGTDELIAKVSSGKIGLRQGRVIAEMPKAKQTTVAAIEDKKERDRAVSRHINAVASKKRAAIPLTDSAPGTPLVRALLSRLETITNEIDSLGMTPQTYAKEFCADFDWREPILVKRLAHASKAIQAISTLSIMSEGAKRDAA